MRRPPSRTLAPAAALLVAFASPSAAQQTTEVRVVPAVGGGGVVADGSFEINVHALLEAELERGGFVATAHFESFGAGACDQDDDCSSSHLGLSASSRGGSVLIGAGFGAGLDDDPDVLFARLAGDPGPLRIQVRSELLLRGGLKLLFPVLVGVRIPW